jgi:hypothetical protein
MFNIPSHKGIANQNYLRFHITPGGMAAIKQTSNKLVAQCLQS